MPEGKVCWETGSQFTVALCCSNEEDIAPKSVLCQGLDREAKARAAACSPKPEGTVDGSPEDKIVDGLAYTIEGLTWS